MCDSKGDVCLTIWYLLTLVRNHTQTALSNALSVSWKFNSYLPTNYSVQILSYKKQLLFQHLFGHN